MSDGPRFAVVGRVNKGKSSIIATLAEDDRVPISRIPGTTTRCQEFPVQVDGKVLFTLVDTPGFEQAPRLLAWLKQTDPPVTARAARVAEFLAAFAGTDEFVEERQLLTPIVAGAGILYAVDGTKPYRDNYESEMEVLRWTGQPGMALINRIGDADHGAGWRAALDQYFKVVRDFDAHAATYDERLRLLQTFRELKDSWHEPLDAALRALRGERDRRLAEVGDAISELLIDELTYTLETRIDDAANRKEEQAKLEQAFHEWLRERERRERATVEGLYRHGEAFQMARELARPVFDQDLFAEKTWDLFGLSPRQLLALYSLSGAAVGGVLDVSVGGSSLLAGSALGAMVGAAGGFYHLKQRFARAASVDSALKQLRRAFATGTAYRIGPHAHPNFPFVLLDRALVHHEAVRLRAHARQDERLVLAEGGSLERLAREEREELHKLFQKIRKAHQDVPVRLRETLTRKVRSLVERHPERRPTTPA